MSRLTFVLFVALTLTHVALRLAAAALAPETTS